MSIDEMNGMIRAYKEVKKYCESIKHKKETDIVDKSINTTLNSVIYLCNKFEEVVEQSIDGEIERMYEMMEHNKAMKDSEMIEWQKENLKTTGGEDDRQDQRDL